MPNWCANRLTLKGTKEQIEEFATAFKRGETCETYIPRPVDLEGELITEVGPDHWYTFSVENWGTKWDIGGTDDAGPGTAKIVSYKKEGEDRVEITVAFDSAWSPPIGLYVKLKQMGLYVDASYFEGGMGFAGIWQDGKDECYAMPFLSWQRWPKKILEEYAVEDCYKADWAEEDDEEEDDEEE